MAGPTMSGRSTEFNVQPVLAALNVNWPVPHRSSKSSSCSSRAKTYFTGFSDFTANAGRDCIRKCREASDRLNLLISSGVEYSSLEPEAPNSLLVLQLAIRFPSTVFVILAELLSSFKLTMY